MSDLSSVIQLSVLVAWSAMVLCLPPAVFFGYVFSRGRFPGKSLLELIVYAPLVVPPVVTGYALLMLFSPGGPLAWQGRLVMFQWTGAALASAVVALPLAVRTARVAFDAVDPELEEAAATLGLSPSRVRWQVVFPMAAPGLIAAGVLAFARALGEFGATITFVGNIPGASRTLPLAIWTQLQTPGGDERALIYVAASLALALAALAVSELLVRLMKR